jgi:outer membrane protein assembly factor BamB
MARAAGLSLLFLPMVSLLLAAGTTVKSGRIESVSAAGAAITIKFSRSDTESRLLVSKDAIVRFEGKSTALSDLKSGMAVTVEINSDGQVERILARSAVQKSARPATVKKLKPKLPTSRKTAKASSKSFGKRKTPEGTGDAPALSPNRASLSIAKNSESPFGFKGGAKWGAGWPGFLGPNRDNISRDVGLLTSWPQEGPALFWRCDGLGQGYSTVAISDGMVFTMGTPANQESLLAIDLETGKALWSVPTGGQIFQDANGNGPRSTPTIDAGRAYVLGATGQLLCVDIKTQAIRWQLNILQEFGAGSLRYGVSESVLIDGPRLICTPGGQLATMVALDKDTGKLLWKSNLPGIPSAAYASAIVSSAGGTREYINYLSSGVVGVRAIDGQPLWGNDATGRTPANCMTPVAFQDDIFVSSSYGGGGALVHLAAGDQGIQANLLYHTREMNNHHGGLVAVDGFLYGANNDVLTCFNLQQGQTAWRNRSVGKCCLTYADRHLYVRGENGQVALVEATQQDYRETGRFMPLKNTSSPAWAYPVVTSGRLFLRDQDDLLCYSLRAAK